VLAFGAYYLISFPEPSPMEWDSKFLSHKLFVQKA
jgi:hypothetical protein